MSTERGAGKTGKKAAKETRKPTVRTTPATQPTPIQPTPSTPPNLADEQDAASSERKPAAKRDQASESTSPTTPDDAPRPRQVIAVSASKGPAAFFNLARKFLVTDEMCDLSALEGAIVSAVDAAHLLERSKLATIVRVQTSYVSVEPKRRKSTAPPQTTVAASVPQEQDYTLPEESQAQFLSTPTASRGRPSTGPSPGRELRRARIVITVKRTESYRQWLEENPLQAMIAGDAGDDEEDVEANEVIDDSATGENVQRR